MKVKTITFLGVDMLITKYDVLLEHLRHLSSKTLVFTPNPEIFVRAESDAVFKHILTEATYNLPDGTGLYVGYEIAKGKGIIRAFYSVLFCRLRLVKEYGERILGSNLTRDLLQFAAQTGKSILILDRKNKVPKNTLEKKKGLIQVRLREELQSRFPGLNVLVYFEGEVSNLELAHTIEKEKISYVFSCLGMKRQEEALVDIFSYLTDTISVGGFGVGASIDFLLGLQKRAPIIFQRLGMEWLYRLIKQPKIRFKRIYTALAVFPLLVKRITKHKGI